MAEDSFKNIRVAPACDGSFKVEASLGEMDENTAYRTGEELCAIISTVVPAQTLRLIESWHPVTREGSFIIGGPARSVFAALEALHQAGFLSQQQFHDVALPIRDSAEAEEALANAGASLDAITPETIGQATQAPPPSRTSSP